MWRIVTSTLKTCHQRRSSWIKYCFQGRRFFLSEAYRCQEAWESRLQAPILQNLKLDDMYYELDQKFQQDGKASVIDVDLFANAISDESHVEELEDLLHKLRFSSNTVHTLPSTPHAFIRLFLALKKDEELLEILNDRLNYGVFPDDYCSGLLMDTFIKKENYTAAARVSALQMLQEDWDNSITSHLALYSCHMYLKNPGQWETVEEPHETDDTEEVKVRVKFLRNPFFDDHFDLRCPNLLVGKTLASLGATMADSVGCTYHLIGLALYNKWEKCIPLLQQFIEKKQVVFKEGVKLFQELLEKQPAGEDGSFDSTREKLTTLLATLSSSELITEDDFHKAVLDKVQQKVTSLEEEVIKTQKQLYKSWEKQRMTALQEQMEVLKTQQRLAKVQEEKKMLMEKEQELFFFENEDKWDLVIDSKRVFYPKRYFGKLKKKRVQDEHYVPPEI